MSTLDRLFAEARDLEDYARLYAQYVSQLLADLDCAAIGRVGDLLESARKANARIFIIGNGGSASTASHLANDLGFGPRRLGGAPYQAISLTDNAALLTAIANDTHYDDVFVEQLRTLLHPGDLVLAISASGNSPNILKAVQYARREQAVVVAFTGFCGGELRNLADEVVHISTAQGDYGPVEDVHLFLDHLLTSYLARLTARASVPVSASTAASRSHALVDNTEPASNDKARIRPAAARVVAVDPPARPARAEEDDTSAEAAYPVAR